MATTNYQGTVGYIGLGNMGSGIAIHLAEVGVNLVVYDLNQAAIDTVAAKGARGATSLEDVVKSSNVIIVCVDPEPNVPKVVDALAEFLRPGQTVVVQSSVPPGWVKDMAQVVAAKGAKLFDAPVSGSFADRQNGTLSVLTGASREEVGPVSDLLESIGRPLYLDALGGGEAVKLANNAIMTVSRLAVAESMALSRSFGLSEEKMIEAVKISSGACFAIDNWGYFEEQARTGFVLKMSQKQTLEILEIAEEQGVRMRLTEAVRDNGIAIDEDRYRYITGKDPAEAYA